MALDTHLTIRAHGNILMPEMLGGDLNGFLCSRCSENLDQAVSSAAGVADAAGYLLEFCHIYILVLFS